MFALHLLHLKDNILTTKWTNAFIASQICWSANAEVDSTMLYIFIFDVDLLNSWIATGRFWSSINSKHLDTNILIHESAHRILNIFLAITFPQLQWPMLKCQMHINCVFSLFKIMLIIRYWYRFFNGKGNARFILFSLFKHVLMTMCFHNKFSSNALWKIHVGAKSCSAICHSVSLFV